MKLIAKYYVNNYKLYTEEHHLVSQVQKNLTRAKQLSVLSASGELLARIEQKNSEISLTCSDRAPVKAQLQYLPENLPFHPPLAHELSLSAPWGTLNLVQTPRREFEVRLNRQSICFLTRMTGITKEIRILKDALPCEYYGIIFALAFLMLHDDDIEIV